MAVATAALAGFWVVNHSGERDEVQVFQGVWYGCERLAPDQYGSGLMYYVRVDLTAPGIELYVTPRDPVAVQTDKLYRLRYTGVVAGRENLAVAVNGPPFRAHTRIHDKLPIPGDLADWTTMSVAAGQVSHFYQHSYMIWFDHSLTPHLRLKKPPSEEELAQAYWGVSSEQVIVYDGEVRGGSGAVNPTTLLGFNRRTKQLYLAVFERCAHARGATELAKLGVTDAIFLDGGPSTTMVLGDEAVGMRPGTVMGGWRPVATHFGVRALPLE